MTQLLNHSPMLRERDMIMGVLAKLRVLFDHHRSAPSQLFLIDGIYDGQLHPTQYLSF